MSEHTSWECQGRQEHGWFGDGTCGDKTGNSVGRKAQCIECIYHEIERAAHTVVGLLAGPGRQVYERHFNQGGIEQLKATVPAWVRGASAKPETFGISSLVPMAARRSPAKHSF